MVRVDLPEVLYRELRQRDLGRELASFRVAHTAKGTRRIGVLSDQAVLTLLRELPAISNGAIEEHRRIHRKGGGGGLELGLTNAARALERNLQSYARNRGL